MRRTIAFALAAAGFVPAAAGAQQVRAQSRPLQAPTADSLFVRVQTSNVEDVMRIVKDLGQREDRLVGELLATSDEPTRRRLLEELSQLTREKFRFMSLVEMRCAEEAGPQPPGYMGVHLLTYTDSTTGAVTHTIVKSVDPGSPAQRAGLLAGDTLITLGGRDVRRSLPDARGLLEPGSRVTLRVVRERSPRDLVVTVAPRPSGLAKSCGEFERVLMPLRVATPGRFTMEGAVRGEGPRGVIARSEPRTTDRPLDEARIIFFGPELTTPSAPWFAGAQFRTLDDEWRAALNLKPDVTGVFVNAVAPGSPTAQAGLKKGDVVTMVGDSPASSPTSLVNMLILTERPETTLQVLRAGERRSLVLRLPR